MVFDTEIQEIDSYGVEMDCGQNVKIEKFGEMASGLLDGVCGLEFCVDGSVALIVSMIGWKGID